MAYYYKIDKATYKPRVFRIKHASFANPFREDNNALELQDSIVNSAIRDSLLETIIEQDSDDNDKYKTVIAKSRTLTLQNSYTAINMALKQNVVSAVSEYEDTTDFQEQANAPQIEAKNQYAMESDEGGLLPAGNVQIYSRLKGDAAVFKAKPASPSNNRHNSQEREIETKWQSKAEFMLKPSSLAISANSSVLGNKAQLQLSSGIMQNNELPSSRGNSDDISSIIGQNQIQKSNSVYTSEKSGSLEESRIVEKNNQYLSQGQIARPFPIQKTASSLNDGIIFDEENGKWVQKEHQEPILPGATRKDDAKPSSQKRNYYIPDENKSSPKQHNQAKPPIDLDNLDDLLNSTSRSKRRPSKSISVPSATAKVKEHTKAPPAQNKQKAPAIAPNAPVKPKREPKESEKNQTKPSKRGGAPFVLALALCVILFTFSAIKFCQELIPQVTAANEIRTIKVDTADENKTVIETHDGKTKTRTLPDWDGLLSQNKDIIGWIFLDGANIDHPLVQGADNSYYLSHTFKKSSNSSGSIFLDYRNSKNFTDQNTVVYGHSMKTGTMFGKLKNYANQSIYEKDPIISIYTQNKEYHYQIFSTITVDAMYDYRQPNYGDSFAGFIKSLKNKSSIRSSATVTEDDTIITLSTCTSSIENGRFVVFGVLLNKDGEEIDLSKIKP